jgi:chitosanase
VILARGLVLLMFLALGIGQRLNPAAHRSAAPAHTSTAAGLDAPREKQIAMELVSSAENSTLHWRREYGYLQDIGDGRGYTGGLIGFCSGTGDMLALVRAYVRAEPHDPLARFLPALVRVNGSASHRGLGAPYVRAWHRAAHDPVFQRLQMRELDRAYFDPAVRRAKADGLGTLGQFIYYDAMVMHGPGPDPNSFGGIRARAVSLARTPAMGGNQTHFLNVFLDVRTAAMKRERDHHDTSRIDDEQRVFLREGNLTLTPPLVWHTYGDRYEIR